jgi:predicted RNA-binding Zn ribbon-like protein
MTTIRDLSLVGGHPVLDLANTVEHRGHEPAGDCLADYPAFLAWCARAGVLNARDAGRLKAHAIAHPHAAKDALRRVVELRELVHAAFDAVCAGRRVSAETLAKLDSYALRAFAHLRLRDGAAGPCWDWDAGSDPLERPLWVLTRLAVALLTDERRRFIRRCRNPNCDWLFLDTSRNQRRRWCDTRTCGNLTRVRRFRARTRAAHAMKAR